jgi:hypothetical protein
MLLEISERGSRCIGFWVRGRVGEALDHGRLPVKRVGRRGKNPIDGKAE